MPTESKPEQLLEQIQQLLDAKQEQGLSELLADRHPADLAEVLGRLSHDERTVVFGLIDEERAGEILEQLDPAVLQDVARDIPAHELSDIAESMPPEEAADLLADLPDAQAEKVLDLMDPEQQEQVQDLLQYPEDSAGGRMRPLLAAMSSKATAAQTIDELRKIAPEEPAFYIYVVDETERLMGVVPLHALVVANPGTRLEEICDSEVIKVNVDDDQEAVAATFKKYDLVAVPVVDGEGRLVGRVLSEDIIDVISEEATEDVYRMAGLDHEELESWSPVKVAMARLPWLLICLGGTMLSALVAHLFHVTIEKLVVVVLFIPAIAAMGGNMGLQTSAVAIRGMATGQLDRTNPLRHMLKEIGSAFLVALACGTVTGLVAWIWGSDAGLGLVVGSSMFVAMSTAAMLGSLLPLFLRGVGVDPALASGPLLTTINDSLGLLIYLGLATIFLLN